MGRPIRCPRREPGQRCSLESRMSRGSAGPGYGDHPVREEFFDAWSLVDIRSGSRRGGAERRRLCPAAAGGGAPATAALWSRNLARHGEKGGRRGRGRGQEEQLVHRSEERRVGKEGRSAW